MRNDTVIGLDWPTQNFFADSLQWMPGDDWNGAAYAGQWAWLPGNSNR